MISMDLIELNVMLARFVRGIHIPHPRQLYNLRLTSDHMTDKNDDWERDMIREMTRVFEQMGLPIDMRMLENMMSELEKHFERMGIDAKSISKTDISFNGNGDPEEIRRI